MSKGNRLILKGLFKGEEQEVLNVTNIAFDRNEHEQQIVIIWVNGKMSKEIPFDDLVELTPMVETDREG